VCNYAIYLRIDPNISRVPGVIDRLFVIIQLRGLGDFSCSSDFCDKNAQQESTRQGLRKAIRAYSGIGSAAAGHRIYR
jgi:hypothetical protein